MSWSFFKKNKKDKEVELAEIIEQIPLSTLYRWYVYDLDTKDPNKLVKAFDLTPVSDEGDEKEREDADLRIAKVEHLIPYLNLYANMNARYIFETQKDEMMKSMGVSAETLENEADSLMMFYQNITFAGLVTAFSSAVELGLVKSNGSYTDIK